MVLHAGEQTMMLLKKIFASGWQSFYGMITGVAALVAPAIPLAITAYLFILLDLYYGYRVNKKFGKKKEGQKTYFESSKLQSTVNKLFEATAFIVLAVLLDKYLFITYEELASVKIAAGAICFTETISLLESLRALHPKALLSRLVQKIIKSKAEKYLEIDITDILEEHNNLTDDNKYIQPTQDQPK